MLGENRVDSKHNINIELVFSMHTLHRQKLIQMSSNSWDETLN